MTADHGKRGNGSRRWLHCLAVLMLCGFLPGPVRAAEPVDRGPAVFRAAAEVLEARCITCHNGADRKGGLVLQTTAGLSAGSDNGRVVVPGEPGGSRLIEMVSGDEPAMPRKGGPLSDEQVQALRRWVEAGAPFPEGVTLEDGYEADLTWWSFRPLEAPAVPELEGEGAEWVRTPIDAFILRKLRAEGLSPSAGADRRTLIRRLYFDLIGLPPSPEQVERFVQDDDPRAYEKLVDRLLDSPAYGERWARHWLDVVHYGDTHGYDKDKLRPNAWPYRDYVIRSLNEGKRYSRFVKEQLAGDVLWPNTRDGVVATGFIAAGPWDFVGQVEVDTGTMEKRRVRNLDRSDMIKTAMNTFVSLTVQCARCHDHKFDPITQADHYRLQAVFAGVDRADRPYEPSREVAQKRAALKQRRDELTGRERRIEKRLREEAGPELARVEQRIERLRDSAGGEKKRPEYGYHSRIERSQDQTKWVQVDLGEPTPIERIVYVGAHDDYNGIGAGFGFPERYRIELSNDADFEEGVTVVEDRTSADASNPGVRPQTVWIGGKAARYVRFTATKLAERRNDYMLALAELSVFTPGGENAAAGAEVAALDSIESPQRWRRKNLVDGYYYGTGGEEQREKLAELRRKRAAIIEASVEGSTRRDLKRVRDELKSVQERLEALPEKKRVYAAATDFDGRGNFVPTGGDPRPVYLLKRGSIKTPATERGPMRPGAVAAFDGLRHHFEKLPADHSEGDRRAALAAWITDERNPLTWRSIVNRVWYYHFGRGLSGKLNDFGRMGSEPTHPELLDWLAVRFRDGGQSLKDLHRLIVTSAVYRQTSQSDAEKARIDAANRFLWRMNRRKLEAEPIRDAVLKVAGKLDREMGGPGFKPFGFKDDHSPHYYYDRHDPDDPGSWRRSVYRFIVRSVPDPFMAALDCADPSRLVARRTQTLTALQALALMNDGFMVAMARHFADRVKGMAPDARGRVTAAYRLALGRRPSDGELETLVPLAQEHGLANVCRLIFNSNEFIFVD